MNTKNNYSKLTPGQKEARVNDINKALTDRKAMPELQLEISKTLLDSKGYQERKLLIREGKQEFRSDDKDDKKITQLESEEFPNQTGGNLSVSEPSKNSIMSEQLIQEALNKNLDNKLKLNNEETIRKVFGKINYTRESMGNGREKHTINGKVFSFPKYNEFVFGDMKVNGEYTIDGITKDNDKYDNFKKETSMNKMSPDKVYDILGEFAKAMGITSSIDYNFFRWDTEESKALLQMFRNITGFEGRIPINITKQGSVECLVCRFVNSGFNDYYYDNYDVSFLVGL